jgi:excisionase family DNA binding protein
MVLPKSISEDDTLLSTADVAQQLDVHRSTVWVWIKNGMLKSVRHGTFHGIRPSELARFRSQYNVVPKNKRKKRKKRRRAL